MKIRYSLLIIFYYLFLSTTHSQDLRLAGIKFNSKNVEHNLRTSVLLNDGKPIKLESDFFISFDISFWTLKYFGPILRVDDETGEILRIVHIQFRDNDTSYIQIIDPYTRNSIDVKIPKDKLIRNQWYNLKLLWNPRKGTIEAQLNNVTQGKLQYNNTEQILYRFTFGIKDKKNFFDIDVPGMCLKNIEINEQGKRKYYWSLNPLEKESIIDQIGGLKIKLINTVWIYKDQQKWRKIAKFRAPTFNGAAFDSVNSRFFLDVKDKLIVYNLITGENSFIKYKTESPATWNDLFYDIEGNRLYSFINGMGNVSIFDLNKGEWFTVPDTIKNGAAHYFGSAKFIEPNSNELFLLGGYGWYTAKNDLFKYNFEQEQWEKIKLKINEMNPRAWFAFGKGFNEKEYYIYGGIGNKTGLQEQGFNVYHDFYVLDLNDSTIKKPNLPNEHISPYAFLINYMHLDWMKVTQRFTSFLGNLWKLNIQFF